MLLPVLVLTLLAAAVEAGSGRNGDHHYELSGAELTALYNSPVYQAERMRRPKGSSSSAVGPFSHTGVRVTLWDGSRWLIHKGDNYGVSSQTVVVDARHMGPDWTVLASKNFQGMKTVSDLVRAGGPDYNLLVDNCHLGSRRMMNQ